VAEVRFSDHLRCYRHTDGDVSCWDILRYHEDGVTRFEDLDAVALDVRHEHACAVLRDGTVKCWGAGEGGQLGHGQYADSAVPVLVQGIVGNVVQVATGEMHTCARTERGQVWCWGQQQMDSVIGLLGNRSGSPSATAVQVRFLEDATDIAVGPASACATRTNGEVMCWGGRLWHEEVLEGVYNAFPQPAPRPADRILPPMTISCEEMCQHVERCARANDPLLPALETCLEVCARQSDPLRQCILDIACEDMTREVRLACYANFAE